MQYIIELVRKNRKQGGRESDVHPEIAAFTSVDSVTAKLTPLCSTAHYSLYLFIPWWYVFYSQNFLDDERVAWLEELLYDNARYENFSKCLFLKLDSESKKELY